MPICPLLTKNEPICTKNANTASKKPQRNDKAAAPFGVSSCLSSILQFLSYLGAFNCVFQVKRDGRQGGNYASNNKLEFNG